MIVEFFVHLPAVLCFDVFEILDHVNFDMPLKVAAVTLAICYVLNGNDNCMINIFVAIVKRCLNFFDQLLFSHLILRLGLGFVYQHGFTIR